MLPRRQQRWRRDLDRRGADAALRRRVEANIGLGVDSDRTETARKYNLAHRTSHTGQERPSRIGSEPALEEEEEEEEP